jgi:hypothetical protein
MSVALLIRTWSEANRPGNAGTDRAVGFGAVFAVFFFGFMMSYILYYFPPAGNNQPPNTK